MFHVSCSVENKMYTLFNVCILLNTKLPSHAGWFMSLTLYHDYTSTQSANL